MCRSIDPSLSVLSAAIFLPFHDNQLKFADREPCRPPPPPTLSPPQRRVPFVTLLFRNFYENTYLSLLCVSRRRYLRLAALNKAVREQDVANVERKAGEEAGSARDGNAWTRVSRSGGDDDEEGAEVVAVEEEGDLRPLAAAVPAGTGVPPGGGGR